ncbi:MAG: peptidoglycan-binding domain-containing protein, partial [Candidatus Paceibacterota bacterium]
MKKYISALVLSVMFLLPALSQAQVSSTVQKRVVPVLKKAYETTVSTTSPVAAPSTPRSVLKQGMKGEDVRYMQAFLYNQGYDIDIDGVFGPGTKRALIAFQKSTNSALSTDGVFGPRTALYIQDMPTGVAVKNLDKGTVDYLKGKHIATITGKDVTTKNITVASQAKVTPNTAKSVIAKLPKDVKSVLAKALPQAPKLTPLQVASNTTPTSTVKPTTKKPKAEILALVSRAKVSLVSATGTKGNLVASANLNTNVSAGEAGKATKEYICAEWGGDNTCVAVSGAIASAVKAGQLDARDVLAEILGNDGQCPFCSKDENGGLVLTSGGGSCGEGGGPGSGEFITPPGTPVGTDPDACVPLADIAGKAYSLAVTSDNVFTAYWGVKGADGNETLQVIGKDMNWDEPTATGTSTQPGWKSAEAFSGTAPANPLNIYFAAFHDGWVTHGFMASLTAGGETYETGSPLFEVAKSTVPGPTHPADFVTSEVLNQIKNATWAQTFLVDAGEHGMSPWGIIPGIPKSAKWIFEGSDWDPEGKMANYEIYKLKICEGGAPTATIDDTCMNFRTDENGQPTNGKAYYKVTFSEPMLVTGTPRLLIKKNASAPIVTAVFDSYVDADHKVLKFI